MSESTDSQLAVTLYTLRDFTQTPADIATALARVREIGYENVQLSALGPIDPERLRQMADAEGLNICATHVPLPRLQQEMTAVIAEHHVWNCRHLAIGGLPQEYRSAAGCARFAEEGSQIGRTLAQAGITFSYHNHWWELERFDDRTGLEILFKQSDPQAILAEPDTAWLHFGGCDPAEWIGRMTGRAPLVHLKDYRPDEKDQYETLPVGKGVLDWPGILRACRDAGVQYYIVEQDFCEGDPFDAIAASRQYLTSLMIGRTE